MDTNKLIIYFIIGVISSLALTSLILKWLIPYLVKKKIGQPILELGPNWHMNKQNTPTMGGISFIVASSLVFLTLSVVIALTFKSGSAEYKNKYLIAIVGFAFAIVNGFIGVIDDSAKVFKRKNEGLSEIAKLVLQFVVTAIYLTVLAFLTDFNTELLIPIINVKLDLGIFYYLVNAIFIVGILNAVNFTDGIDGLASSVSVLVFIFFAFVLKDTPESMFSLISAAAVFGFFLFNKYPAKVFMGDTGSLFLGGALAGIAVCRGYALYLVIAGGVYVIETLSVILQVAYFKATGKRLFKMSPIHHHFEMCGWSERKIVLIFSVVTVCLCALAAVKFI